MNKEILLKNTIANMQLLPDTKIQEVNDFVEFLLNKQANALLIEEIQYVTSHSKAFDFLQDEPDLYSIDDLKNRYK